MRESEGTYSYNYKLQAYTVSKIYVCLAKITSIGASGGPYCDLRVGWEGFFSPRVYFGIG